jgi:hypothetical protein
MGSLIYKGNIKVTEALPCWSLSMIINGDSSSLNEDDITLVNRWFEFWGEREYIVGVPDNAEGSFTSRPAFGLPCDCIDCTIVLVDVEMRTRK